MINSEKGHVKVYGMECEVMADLEAIVEALREEGLLPRKMYELIWKMSEPKESTTIDIEELRRQMNDTM